MPHMTRAEKNRIEVDLGRRTTLRNMAEGLLETLQSELPGKHSYRLMDAGDFREWIVVVTFEGTDVRHEELFTEFPSNELRTKLMLLTR